MCAKSNEIHTSSGDITNCPLAQILTYKCKSNMCEIVTKGVEIKGAMSQLFSKEIVCQKIYKVRKLLVIVTASYLTIRLFRSSFFHTFQSFSIFFTNAFFFMF